jgi:hypothetical protein
MTKPQLLRRAVITVIGIVLLSLLWKHNFGWHRPYINWAPWDLAEYLAEHKRPAHECFDLVWFEIMAPSQGEMQALCVREYAERTKDPTACELLMPSRYGLDCVGAARKPNQCNFYQGEVSWVENDVPYHVPYGACGKADAGRSIMGEACCTMALVSLIRSENDCSSLTSYTTLYDECQFLLGFKTHEPSICDTISDRNIKAACTVSAKALKEDPSICVGCATPVESIDDLQ